MTINAIIADQFSVTVTAGEGGKVNGKSSDSKSYSDGDATGAQDFRIVAGAGRTIIAPDGVTLDSDGYIESISGLSEDTTYAFTFGYQTYSVSGDLTDEATYGTDFTWMPSVDGATVVSVSYRIGSGEQVNLDRPEDKNADGSYTIPGELILDDITVTYVVANSEWEFISKKQYGGLEKGTKIAILKADAPEEGAYFIDGEPMYVYNGSIGTYTNGTIGFMIIVDENETEESLTAKLNIVKEATNETLANSTDEDSGVVRGDFGGDGAVDLDDIGALNAILSGKKSSKITMKQRLSADVNGDGVVNLRDIMWLMEEMAGLPHS